MGVLNFADAKKDQMTPKERDKAFRENRPYDRIPCGLFLYEHAVNLIGARVSDFHHKTGTVVEAFLAARKEYEIESVGVGPGLQGIAEAFGCRLEFPAHNTPYIAEAAVKNFSDIDRLEIPDPARHGRLPRLIKTNERLLEVFGKDMNVFSSVAGPFTTAANLRGTEQFMKDIYRSPEFVHRLLRLSTDATISYVKEAAKSGVYFSIADPTASGTLIREDHFEEFALPYLKELTGAIIKETSSAPQLHICGNTKKLWKHMAETGAGALSLDDQIDLEEAKYAVGDRITLVGNIRPTATMYSGKPEDVINNAKDCLRKAYDNPGGYILALGCGLPIDTPPENIHALVYSARKYGSYPLDPSLFM
ncbi:MAG: uroporphyrinogen decarboxylase family protein [Brevinematales bacterium]|jgi:uroporphyrinogen decarboxylase